MNASTVTGRVALAIYAVGCAALLLHGQLSSALVSRGDALAYWGRRDQARLMYARAIFFDGRNRVAVDRYVFDAALSKNPAILRGGVVIANEYLTKSPDDGTILMDRALCFQHERSFAAAIADFQRAGQLERDPRAFMFAALDERAFRQRGRARALLRAAIALDRHFKPAQLELART